LGSPATSASDVNAADPELTGSPAEMAPVHTCIYCDRAQARCETSLAHEPTHKRGRSSAIALDDRLAADLA
jgi:hypothetical protein